MRPRRMIVALALLACGSNHAANSEFAPCSDEACVPASVMDVEGNVLCKSTCADGFACLAPTAYPAWGQCMRICASDADCTHNHFAFDPPLCSRQIDFSDVTPGAWCVDDPKVTQ